jgi:nitrous oxide reductase accessory protein NosL
MMDRRRFLLASALTPLAVALAACGKKGTWPEGMTEIKWDRDTCVRCSMVISDRRFAAQIKGGAKNIVFKFDDIGCASFWLRDKLKDFPWMTEAATSFWVADVGNAGDNLQWHDARKAQYIGKASPMGYNYAAVGRPQAMSVDFATMREHVLAKGK